MSITNRDNFLKYKNYIFRFFYAILCDSDNDFLRKKIPKSIMLNLQCTYSQELTNINLLATIPQLWMTNPESSKWN